MEIKNRKTVTRVVAKLGRPAGEWTDTQGTSVAFTHPTPKNVMWKCEDGVDPELFHPETDVELEAAVAFCAGCHVKDVCLGMGLARKEFGVWGGVLLEYGKALEAVPKRGRPKAAVA